MYGEYKGIVPEKMYWVTVYDDAGNKQRRMLLTLDEIEDLNAQLLQDWSSDVEWW